MSELGCEGSFEDEDDYNMWMTKRALHHIDTSEYLFAKAMDMAQEDLETHKTLEEIEW
jgi:hypothetical protein